LASKACIKLGQHCAKRYKACGNPVAVATDKLVLSTLLDQH